MQTAVRKNISRPSPSIDMDPLVMGLSEALGLAGGPAFDHGKRVAYLAMSLAENLGLPQEAMIDLRYAALLHDAGRFKEFTGFARVLEIIGHHRERWVDLKSSPVPGQTAIMSNLVFLADHIDFLIDWSEELILSRDGIEADIRELAGDYFNPDAVSAFMEKSKIEVFWLNLYPRHLPRALDYYRPLDSPKIDLDQLESLAGIFADIVDGKSTYTLNHSQGVSRLCHHLAVHSRLDGETVQKLRIAGLLHDLGKLAVPVEILDKPSNLTPMEFQIVKRHPFETFYILSQMPELQDIRDWASFHHERLDGSGYPFHISSGGFRLEHLIVMLSDIIQALVQERPYRPGLNPDDVLDILQHLSRQQTDFAPLVKIVHRDIDLFIRLAQGPRDRSD